MHIAVCVCLCTLTLTSLSLFETVHARASRRSWTSRRCPASRFSATPAPKGNWTTLDCSSYGSMNACVRPSITVATEVWLPIIAVNNTASVLTLQKLSELHASNVDSSVKMSAASKIADSTTDLLVANPQSQDQRPRMLLDPS